MALAAVPAASADHVAPTFVPGPDNFTCADFAEEGTELNELKVDPAADGVYTDGNLTVTVDVDADTKVFSFTASSAVVGLVFVKAGSAGHHLYEYDPPTAADSNVTSPGDDDTNQISHISFCYVPCEAAPDLPECATTCEDQPDMPECDVTCEDQPDMPECDVTCEDQPDMPECVAECPATVTALANDGGSITVTITSNTTGQLLRSAGDGPFELVMDFTGNSVFEDTNTTVGVTYTYRVTVGGQACDDVEVTAIPVFPTILAGMAAAALGVVGYVMVRRRK